MAHRWGRVSRRRVEAIVCLVVPVPVGDFTRFPSTLSFHSNSFHFLLRLADFITVFSFTVFIYLFPSARGIANKKSQIYVTYKLTSQVNTATGVESPTSKLRSNLSPTSLPLLVVDPITYIRRTLAPYTNIKSPKGETETGTKLYPFL